MSDDLPSGWALLTPPDIAAREPHSLGIGPFGSDLKVSDYRDSGVPLIFVRNVRSHVFDGQETRYISAEKAEDLRAHWAMPGDVLITKMGDPPGDACVYPHSRPIGVITADCIRWRVDPSIAVSRFLSYAVGSPRVRSQVLSITKGVAQLKVSLGRFSGVRFPLPPVGEQRKVVDALDSLFSRLDDAVISLKRVQRNLKRYRAAVLQAAVEGRLVPTEAELARAEGRSFEPASELLARILTERRRRWEESELAKLRAKGKEPKIDARKNKYVEPQPFGVEDRRLLPDGWCWASIDQVGEVVTGTTPATSRAEFYGGTLPFLKPTDLDAGYWSSDAREFLSTLGAASARPVPPLAVLVTCIGATIGKVGLARAECATNQQINALVPEDPIRATRFMYWYLASPIGKREVVGNSSATTLPILNKTKFERLPVRLPPLLEQHRIVAEVERLVSVVDVIEHEAHRNLTRCHRLRQSILKWAFEGKLVDQDPRDEPASVLLERIRAERARAPARPARGRRPKAARGPALPGVGG